MMKTCLRTVIAAGALAFSAVNGVAATPTSVTFESDGKTADGTQYSNYVVKCSDGKSLPLTAWDDNRKWCVGKESEENCSKKQIKAATAACKLS